MRKQLFSLIAGLVLVAVLATRPVSTDAQAGSAADLIAAVNQLRAANGLPALQVNSTLMSIAQSHSSYQASIGSVTHTGAGGTRPRDRAVNAGYGGGGTIFISENIAGGTNLSVPEVISWWQGDAPHLNTMLGGSYQEIGAGVATSGSFVYYTIDVGSASGSAGSGPPPANPPEPTNPGGGGGAGFVLAEPAADGSITHEVQTGQTLIGIAGAYDITVAAIQTLNELGTTTFIYPGDKLLIQPGYTPTPTATSTATATPPRPTRRPPPTATITPTPPPVVAEVDEAIQAEEETDSGIESLVSNLALETERGTLILAILGVAFLLLVAPVLLALFKKER